MKKPLTSITQSYLVKLAATPDGVSSDLHRLPKMRDALADRGLVAPRVTDARGLVMAWAITPAGRVYYEATTYECEHAGSFVVATHNGYGSECVVVAASHEFDVAMAHAIATAAQPHMDGVTVTRFAVVECESWSWRPGDKRFSHKPTPEIA